MLVQKLFKDITEGKIANSDREDIMSGHPKAMQPVKSTAMGQAINKYNDEEVCFNDIYQNEMSIYTVTAMQCDGCPRRYC